MAAAVKPGAKATGGSVHRHAPDDDVRSRADATPSGDQSCDVPRRGLRGHVSETVWSAFVGRGAIRHFDPQETLVQPGETSASMLILTAGRVKVTGTVERQAGLLLAVRAAGDLVGELGLGGADRTVTVRAMDRCTAYRITHRDFHKLLEKHRVYPEFADYLGEKLAETVPYQLRLEHFPPRQRVARMLLEIVALAGPEVADPLFIPCAQETIAMALGLARGAVAFHIGVMRGDGILGPGPRLVIADVAGLRAAAGVEPGESDFWRSDDRIHGRSRLE